MNEHEKALPAGGPAKFTQNAVKIYVISSRERLLLPLAFCFCLLLVNTLLWSGPTAGLTASVCVWYGLLGLYLGRPLLNTWGFTMSMGNRFSYKDFYFSFLFNGVFGKWMTDNVANISSYTFGSGNYIHGVKYWTPETPDAEVVSPGYQASFSHGYYKKLNYVQLRNITLGYRVNQKFVRRIGLSAIDVNFSVNNVCAFSNMRQMLNYDNTWFASFPTARSYVLGLTLTF